ncbi:MAG: hypothetical protein EAX86_06400 [Candidatus Heimdallarchaeota archaeon]|nr:hypothetical protein [Candidatus Heimdallarchaeota archaeon]
MNSSTITSIEDLKPYDNDIVVNFQVIEQLSVKEIRKGHDAVHKVATFKIADATGSIRLTVWNEAIDKIDIGQTYELNKGNVNVFQDHAQLSAGKNGQIKPCDVKFHILNQENNISEQKVVKEKRQSSRRSPKFQKKRYNEEEDTFSAEVNKKYLWAEKR